MKNSGFYHLNQTRGLLPHPRNVKFGPSFHDHQSGLLPHPVKQPRFQKPLLQTPSSCQKMPLLNTPQMKHMSNQMLYPNSHQHVKQPYPDNTYSVTENKKTNYSKHEEDESIKILQTEHAYKLHKEKLKSHKTQLLTLKSSNDLSRDLNKLSSLLQCDDSSNNLSCLANYLIHMKASSQSSTINMSESSLTVVSEKSITLDKIAHSNLETNKRVTNIIDAYENCNEDNKSTTNSAVYGDDLSVSQSIIKQPNNEIVFSNSNSSINSKQMVNSKFKKHTIQLSQYANGNVTTTSKDNISIKNKIAQQSNANASNVFELLSDSYDLQNTDNVSNNTIKNASLTASAPAALIPAFEKSNTMDSTTGFNKSTEIFKDCEGDNVAAANNFKNNKVEKDFEVKPINNNNSGFEKSNKKASEISNLPYIFPVSGYFCDICCDFFFDEKSTLEHCKTIQHQKKTDAAHAKSTALEQSSISGKRNLPSTCKNETNFSFKKMRVSNNSVRFAYDKNIIPDINKKQVFDISLHTNDTLHQQERKQRGGFHQQTGNKSGASNQRGKKRRGGRGKKWNFIIPKRK